MELFRAYPQNRIQANCSFHSPTTYDQRRFLSMTSLTSNSKVYGHSRFQGSMQMSLLANKRSTKVKMER